MDIKKAKILYQIKSHENMTKLDVRKNTGYSMSTVIKNVDELSRDGLILCGQKKVKSGKIPAEINLSPAAYVLGIGYYKNKLYGVRAMLNGSVKSFYEEPCDNFEQKKIIEVSKKLSLQKPPVMIGLICEESDLDVNKIEKELNCKIVRGDLAYGLACFYRFYNLKSNVDLAIVYVDDKIRVLKSGERINYYEVGSLFSPIMNSKKGRLTYAEVLQENNVLERLKSKYSSSFAEMETAFDNEVFFYKERLLMGLAELVTLIDKMLKPSVTVIGGSYVGNEIISKTTANSPYSKLVYAGNVQDAIGAIAASMTFGELYYY